MELGLDDAVKLALDYNLNLQKHRIDLDASGYSEGNLWSEIFPSVNANASAAYRTTLLTGTPFSNSIPNYGIGLGISFSLNAGVPYAIKNIQLAHQSNILRYEDACRALAIQITKRFFALVAEKNNLLLLDEVFNLAQRQFTRSEISFRNGLTGELSLTQSRLALENARYNLNDARISHENNMAEFFAMLGLAPDESAVLIGDVHIIKIEADAEALINEYLHLRPDITRSNQEIERLALSQMQTVMQSRAPSLNLSLDWNGSVSNPFSDTLGATARLSIPLDPWVPGTAREQAISRAANSLEKAKLDLEMTENSARTHIRSLAALLRSSWDSILIARLSLDAARRGYQLTEQGFLNGTVEALTLQDTRNSMASARQRLLQTELSYFNMILDLSAALNIDWKNLMEIYGVPSE